MDISKNKITDISAILFYLIPFSLLTGPFLPDLFLSLVGLFFIILTIKEKIFYYYKSYFFIFFFIFYIYLIINSLVSEFPLFSIQSSIFYFRFGIFALATWFLIENKNNFIKNFSLALLLAFFYAIIDGYYQLYVGHSIAGYNGNHPVRLTLPFNDKLILGGYLSRLFPLLLAFVLLQYSEKKKYLLMISLVLILIDVLIFTSGERTAIGLISIFTFFILIFLSNHKLIRLGTLLLSIIIIILITISSDGIKNRNINETISQIGLDSGSNRVYLFSPGHESHIISAWKMFKHNKLFGVGPNNFRNLCSKDIYQYKNEACKYCETCSTHPHNSFIQLLSETGFIGIMFYLFILCYISYIILSNFILIIINNNRKLTDYQICLLGALIITLWPIAPSVNFFSNYINVIYYLPVGFLLSSFHQRSI
ncbi:O-antigen ligase family protein [Pelagibacterales bacterium]|nr:O-antigen ligase family protein [Pelagibacterales bacterium]